MFSVDTVHPIKLVRRYKVPLIYQLIYYFLLYLLILFIHVLDNRINHLRVPHLFQPIHHSFALFDDLFYLGVKEGEGATVHQIVGDLCGGGVTFTMIFSMRRQCRRFVSVIA